MYFMFPMVTSVTIIMISLVTLSYREALWKESVDLWKFWDRILLAWVKGACSPLNEQLHMWIAINSDEQSQAASMESPVLKKRYSLTCVHTVCQDMLCGLSRLRYECKHYPSYDLYSLHTFFRYSWPPLLVSDISEISCLFLQVIFSDL